MLKIEGLGEGAGHAHLLTHVVMSLMLIRPSLLTSRLAHAPIIGLPKQLISPVSALLKHPSPVESHLLHRGIGGGVPVHSLLYTSVGVQTRGEQQGVEVQLLPTAATHEGVGVGVGGGVGMPSVEAEHNASMPVCTSMIDAPLL